MLFALDHGAVLSSLPLVVSHRAPYKFLLTGMHGLSLYKATYQTMFKTTTTNKYKVTKCEINVTSTSDFQKICISTGQKVSSLTDHALSKYGIF